MNRKQLIILLVLVAVIGGAGLVLLKKHDESWSGSSDSKLGQKLLEKFQVNDVARIHIKGDKEVNLANKDGAWRVEERGDYPANYSSISDFLLKAAELKISQVEPIGESQLERLELKEPGKNVIKAGTLVELKDASGKNLQEILLGKKHVKKMENQPQFRFGNDEFADGRYVMLKSDPKNVILISDALASAEPKPENWLNKDFFKAEKVKSVSFVSTNATNSWKLSRETENGVWSLADTKAGEVLDTNKMASLGSTVSSPSFADVVVNAKAEDTGLDKPLVVTLDTFDHFTYTLKVGKKDAEGNYYTTVAVAAELPKERTPGKDEKPEDKKKLDKEFDDKKQQLSDKLKQEQALAKWTYAVPSWILEPLVKNRAELMVEKKEEPKTDAAEANPADASPAPAPAAKTPPAAPKAPVAPKP